MSIQAVPSEGLSCCWKGKFATSAFEPCFKGTWVSDFPYGQTVTPQTVTWNSLVNSHRTKPASLLWCVLTTRFLSKMRRSSCNFWVWRCKMSIFTWFFGGKLTKTGQFPEHWQEHRKLTKQCPNMSMFSSEIRKRSPVASKTSTKNRFCQQLTLVTPGVIMGQRSLSAKIVKQLIWHKGGSKMGFSSLAGSGPKVGPKWVSGIFFTKSAPNPTLDPLLGQPLPANDEKPIFDQFLCQINCLTTLALRDLRPIITPGVTKVTFVVPNYANYLTAQCEIPPSYRAMPFRDSIAEGGIAPICLVFIGYRASIAEIPLLRVGGIAPPPRMLSKGETVRKGGGGIAPNWPCWDTKNPIARNRGYRWDSLAGSRNTGPLRPINSPRDFLCVMGGAGFGWVW